MRKENELEKAARKHRKKQKYPMSIFSDYKKGAEEFNNNSTPINQDALSSADASSGMAEGIRKNKSRRIRMNEADEPYNPDFVVVVKYYKENDEAFFTGSGDDVVNIVEYPVSISDLPRNFGQVIIKGKINPYLYSFLARLDKDEDISSWGLGMCVRQIVDDEIESDLSKYKKETEGTDKCPDYYRVYVYVLRPEEFDLSKRNSKRRNESINERFTNGTLADFSPRSLMDSVKNRLEALHTIRTNGNMTYIISIHPHKFFARLSPDTEYDVFIVAEDENGSQERISNNYDFDKLLDYEVVDALNKWKQDVLNSGMNEDWDTSVGPTYDCCGITIDFNKLNKQIGKNYQTLYDNNDEIMGGHDEVLSGSDLAYTFDCYVKEMPEFKNLVCAFSNFIQDFISSDREAAAFLFTVDELYPDIWDAIDKCGINESLNEFYDKGWQETGRGWSSDTYKVAEKVYEFLKDNDIWVNIYDYDPDSGEFSLEIDGDWKHEHLRAEWLIEENLKEVDGFRIEKMGSYSLEDSNDDSYRGVHQYRIINVEEENNRRKEMQERRKQFEDSLVKKVVNGKERYVSPDGKMFTKGYFTDSPDETIWFEVSESLKESYGREEYNFDISGLTGEELLTLDEILSDMMAWADADASEDIEELFSKNYNRYKETHKDYKDGNSNSYDDDKAWMYAERSVVNYEIASLQEREDTIKYYLQEKDLSDEQRAVLDKCLSVTQQKSEPRYSVCDKYDFGPWTKYEYDESLTKDTKFRKFEESMNESVNKSLYSVDFSCPDDVYVNGDLLADLQRAFGSDSISYIDRVDYSGYDSTYPDVYQFSIAYDDDEDISAIEEDIKDILANYDGVVEGEDWETLDESLTEDCNSYSYKGKAIIDAGDYWFVKGYKEKFPTSDEAEEFIDDKKKDEGMKINIKESLNKMDAESDNTYDLLNLYESKNLSKNQKKDIARMIYENYGLEKIYKYLYEATEEGEDELPVEDRVKELTNNFKNTNGSYVFEDGQDANKAVTILKSRGYEASQKRAQDGKYRVTAEKKNK